ncbi:hypothetical protein [Spongiimicrobium sp. 3-5]|uniref:hypothetical protein n=1 Tax=Spongiimicrobium sp. 3-5 TaxID=3332596 RepID=UPI00397FA76D
MKKHVLVLIGILGFSFANSQTIKDLDFLIGSWEVTETVFPGTEKEYEEKGTRNCEYYLNGSFIKCESSTVVSKSGKERKYVYLINYDEKEKWYWVTSLAHDFPLHGQHKWFLFPEKKMIHAISPVNVIPDKFFRGTISYKNPNRLVWEGWSSKYDREKEWRQIFSDVAVRTKQ